jgi:hypothetical protein
VKKVSELSEEYSYKVLGAVAEAIDYTAAHPEKSLQLAIELIQKAPVIYDAIINITKPEHRPIIFELFKSALNLAKALTKSEK